ncbi:MAG: DNA repair protein RecO [Luteolibacter sp.]
MISTEAILIRTTRLTDTSLIVHWFTADEGLLKTIAKGALRPKSPFAGKLDLFFSGEIGVARARRGELHHLREVSIRCWRQGIRRDYVTTLMAGYFCQLAEAAVEMEQADVELHGLLIRALDHLDESAAYLKVMYHFEKRLAEVLGIAGQRGGNDAALCDHLGKFPDTRRVLLERFAQRG